MFTLGTTRMCRGAPTCENSETGQTRKTCDTSEPVNPCESYERGFYSKVS